MLKKMFCLNLYYHDVKLNAASVLLFYNCISMLSIYKFYSRSLRDEPNEPTNEPSKRTANGSNESRGKFVRGIKYIHKFALFLYELCEGDHN